MFKHVLVVLGNPFAPVSLYVLSVGLRKTYQQ